MPTVAVAILNWNGKSWMEKFLPNVIENSPEATVYIIDNHSNDDSIEFLENNFLQTPLIILEENYGFAEGYNRGLEKITADYYVLLNSDVQVGGNWIPPIIAEMENDENFGPPETGAADAACRRMGRRCRSRSVLPQQGRHHGRDHLFREGLVQADPGAGKRPSGIMGPQLRYDRMAPR